MGDGNAVGCSDNRKLIRQIASPYIRHMAADSNDLFQEAAIAAYKALISSQKKEKPNQFVPFFRVIFKTNCIRLASGIQTVQSLEDYQLPCPEKPEERMNWKPAGLKRHCKPSVNGSGKSASGFCSNRNRSAPRIWPGSSRSAADMPAA